VTYICVAHRATATISLPAATDSGATVRVEVQVAAALVGAETGSVAWTLVKNRFYCIGLP